MPLTPEQQAQLEALQAEATRPEPRTETGLAGVLHTILDVVSGAVPHLPPEAWGALHSAAEAQAPPVPEPEPEPEPEPASGGTETAGFAG